MSMVRILQIEVQRLTWYFGENYDSSCYSDLRGCLWGIAYMNEESRKPHNCSVPTSSADSTCYSDLRYHSMSNMNAAASIPRSPPQPPTIESAEPPQKLSWNIWKTNPIIKQGSRWFITYQVMNDVEILMIIWFVKYLFAMLYVSYFHPRMKPKIIRHKKNLNNWQRWC